MALRSSIRASQLGVVAGGNTRCFPAGGTSPGRKEVLAAFAAHKSEVTEGYSE